MVTNMKVHLIGWNENALNALSGLIASKYKITGVTMHASHVDKKLKDLCKAKNINCRIVKNETELKKSLLDSKAQVVVSASWPKIIHAELLNTPGITFINIHAALLPKNRGIHPINWAIIRVKNMPERPST